MVHAVGTYLGGIRTLDDLRARCVVDDITGCWLWSMALAEGGQPHVHYLCPDTGRKLTGKGRRVALLLAGVQVKPTEVAFARAVCAEPTCCNPEHARAVTKKQWGHALSLSGKVKNLPSKCAAARRAWDTRGRRITPAMAAEIRGSAAPVRELAARFAVSEFAVWSCRARRTHLQGMPGSSVFHLRA